MAQNKHCYSKREERREGEEKLAQSKPKPHKGNTTFASPLPASGTHNRITYCPVTFGGPTLQLYYR